jgi:ligand-binding sensor domain-containing protein
LVDLRVHVLVVTSGGTVYAGTEGGVFRFTDTEDRWVAVNAGLRDLDVYALVVTPEGEMYAGTRQGIFRYRP